jgi:exopolysaccharide biosynthesis polyprenyl glycosylphosphotransferase
MSTRPFSDASRCSTLLPFPAPATAGVDAAADGTRRAEFAISLVERVLDFMAVLAAVWLACWSQALWHEGTRLDYSKGAMLATTAGFAVLIVLLLDKHGDYRPCLSLLAVRETERVLRVTIIGFALASPIVLVTAGPIPRSAVGSALVMVPLLLALEKWQTQKAIQVVRGMAAVTRKAVILGTGTAARSIYSTLLRSPKFGLDPVAFVSDSEMAAELVIREESYRHKRQAKVLPGPVTPRLLRRLGASALIIASTELGAEETAEIKLQAEGAGISTYVLPRPFLEPENPTDYVELDGILLAHKAQAGQRHLYEAAKRTLDIVVSALLLVVLSPALAAAAIAVRLTSAGPAIFKQQRVGLNGSYFGMYKFRSMYRECAQYAYSPQSGRDPRITPVGRFLRHTCIDELPQLVNVLRGEMSLVGPRPEMPFIVDEYEAVHRQRLTVKPGITGLWQLSADRRSLIHENISYDLYYVRRRNFLMDAAILLHTIVFAFRGV